jgi:release factor glutamine methyltransferase
VTKDTLIPRPETELLVELVCDEMRSERRDRVLIADIGTGSGNIIITLASALRKSSSLFTLCATDISDRAITIAKKNAERHDVSDRISFHCGDLLEPIREKIFSVDEVIITANLPYLSQEIYQASEDDVKKFEQKNALLSGQSGLGHYSRLLDQMRSIAKPITAFLEISPEQTLPITSSLPPLSSGCLRPSRSSGRARHKNTSHGQPGSSKRNT